MTGGGWADDIIDISDLEQLVYSVLNQPQLKANDPLLTTTTGVNNTLFGVMPWLIQNYEVNPFSVVPKVPYRKSGHRAITSHITMTTVKGNTVYGGISETGQLPEMVKPNYDEIEVDPKISVMTFGESLKHELLAGTEDDTYGGLARLRNHMMSEFNILMCNSLMRDMESTTKSGAFDYSTTKDLTPYDQSISSAAEEDALGGGSGVSGWYDPYGEYDRDVAASSNTAIYDSVVLTASPSGTIGGSNGVLDRGIFTKMRAEVKTNTGKELTLMLMDHETHREVVHLYDGQVRYDGAGTATKGISTHGVTGPGGHSVQIEVGTVARIPIIDSRYSCRNSSDSTQLGKIFGFNTSFTHDMDPVMAFSTLLPTIYMENSPRGGAGMAWGWVGNDLIQKCAFVCIGEQVNRWPNACAKITDIAARS